MDLGWVLGLDRAHRHNLTLPVAGPRVWNSLPSDIPSEIGRAHV